MKVKNCSRTLRNANFKRLINDYNFYLQENICNYIKSKNLDIAEAIKKGYSNENERYYLKGIYDVCNDLAEILRRKNGNKE